MTLKYITKRTGTIKLIIGTFYSKNPSNISGFFMAELSRLRIIHSFRRVLGNFATHLESHYYRYPLLTGESRLNRLNPGLVFATLR